MAPGGDQLTGASASERRKVQSLRSGSDSGARVGGAVIRAADSSGTADIPTPLLVMLILGVLAAGAAGGYAIRSRGLLGRSA